MSARAMQWINKLPPIVEFIIVILLAFGLPSFNALEHLISGLHKLLLSEAYLKFVLTYEIIVLLVLSLFLKKRGWTFTKLGLLLPSWESTILGVILILVVYIIYVLILGLALLIPALQSTLQTRIPVASASGISLWIITSLSILNPLFEELFVCGYIISFLRRYSSIEFAIIISTVIRVLYHLYQPLPGVIFIITIGIVFAYYYANNNQLWPLILAHAFFDFWGLLMIGR